MTSASNPAADPLHGVAAPIQTEQPIYTGGTNHGSGAVALATPGGLPPLFSLTTGTTSSLASKMYECNLSRSIGFSTNTTAGTLLDSVIFNPWSTNCVNEAAVTYGSIHKFFTGSIFVTYEIVSAATMLGKLLMAYIPSTYGPDYVVDRNNAYLFDHVIMDVSAPGKATLELKPTTTSDFVVERDDGKYYGKIVLIAQTDIVNTYGATVTIPLNVYTQLASGSMYTGLDLASQPALGFPSRRQPSPPMWAAPSSQKIEISTVD